MTIRQTVERFALLTHTLADPELEKVWAWEDYTEGVRFAFFRVYEELRTLAAELHSWRASASQPQSIAQHILTQYHAAYRDLQAVLLGIDEHLAYQAPAEDEWSLWEVLLHIIGAERGFFAINLDALERERTQDRRPMEMTEEAWQVFWTGDRYKQIKERQSYGELLEYHQSLHQRVLHAFQDISNSELDIPVVFWEKNPMALRFRLHRFDSHLRQHTVQAEKTLAELRFHPNEARRLLRLIYTALAEVEGTLIGDTRADPAIQSGAAARIAGYMDEIAPLIT